MWPFKKSQNPGRIVPDPEGKGWVNMKGEIHGLPAFIRYDASLKRIAPHPDYRHEILVTIAFNSAGDSGLPSSKDDLCEVDDIEDLFKARLEKTQTAILALILTNDGVRELYFYSSNPDDAIRQWEDSLQPRIDTHQVEFAIRPDPDWGIYQKFALG